MPWKRKRISPRRIRLLFIVLVVAVCGGILAALAGGLLQARGSVLVNKYSAFKSLLGNYSESEIRAAMEKR